VKHLGLKEAMMFCRFLQRRACVLLVALLASAAGLTAAAAPSEKSADSKNASMTPPQDSALDVRPMEFDPVLSPAVTPAPVEMLNPGNEKQATIIPLPPAAWTGMASLVGLGLIRARHKLRRFLS
jgi:hypothetical protein